MTLSLDLITLGVPDVGAAHTSYAALSATAADHGGFVDVDLHGAGHLGLHSADRLAAEAGRSSAGSGFRGYVLTYIVAQPNEVDTVVEAASGTGARVLKPAKKGLFSEYSAVLEMPDGALWKVAAETKRNRRDAASPPVPTETSALLGVADPKVSKVFYQALGMTPEHDYGSTFVDFRFAPGASRLGLMPRAALAKDAGVSDDGSGFSGLVLHQRVETAELVDSTLAAAAEAGGEVTMPAEDAEWGGRTGHFADPDGFVWKIGFAG